MIGVGVRELRWNASNVDCNTGAERCARVCTSPRGHQALSDFEPLGSCVAHDEDELVAAKPRHGVLVAQIAEEMPPEVSELVVASSVPERVVHNLQTVEIENGERVSDSERLQEGLAKPAIANARQRVRCRFPAELSEQAFLGCVRGVKRRGVGSDNLTGQYPDRYDEGRCQQVIVRTTPDPEESTHRCRSRP